MKITYEQAIDVARPLTLLVADNGSMALQSKCGYGLIYWQCWAPNKPEYIDENVAVIISEMALLATRMGQEKLVEMVKEHHRKQSEDFRKAYGLQPGPELYEIKPYEYFENKGWKIPIDKPKHIKGVF